jgi:hypothetical protein
MPSITKTLVSLLSLTALAVATPTNRGASHHRRDACSASSHSITATATDIATATVPDLTATATATSTAAPKPDRIFGHEIYEVLPARPDVARAPVPFIHLETMQNVSTTEQVVVFRGIPAGATTCSMGWRMGPKEDRIFLEMGDIQLRADVLAGVDFAPNSADVSYSTVQGRESGETLSPNFTWWSTSTDAPGDHPSGAVTCAEDLYLKIVIASPLMPDSETEPAMYWAMDADQGFYIDYVL